MRLILGALALLGACVALPGGGVQTLDVAGGAVTVQGPEGFCVDTRTSRPGRGFAVLASCALVSDMAVVPGIEGLITVQVGDAGSALVAGSERDLVSLLQSPTGAALLAGNGDAGSIDLDFVDNSPGLVLVHFTDSAAPMVPGVEALEWRAFLDLGDRLATIGVRGFARDPLGRDEGLRLLNRAVFALRAANRVETVEASEG